MNNAPLSKAAADAIGAGPLPEPVDWNDLLTRHAPIVCFSERELFLPMAVDGYIEASELHTPGGRVAAAPSVADVGDRWPAGTWLQFVTDEDRVAATGQEVGRSARLLFASRLGRVGLFGRLLDALFLLSVWIRPTVPRRTTVAAAAKVERLGLESEPVCYGRVVRAGEWLVLHYSWFYAMNDWRSSHRGLNDHEADWEQAWVYCDPETFDPIWVAASNHESRGVELRRHWNDPELGVLRGHPVLYAAAGSHALFFQPGDFVTRIDIPTLRWLLRVQQSVRRFFRRHADDEPQGLGPALGVPFIDSAAGDGVVIEEWDLRNLSDVAWAEEYRGLWGLDTGDPLQGERGPSGPKFDRRGEIRASWADPLGFAGLHGSPPPSAVEARVNLDKIDRAMEELDERIRNRGRLLPLAHQTRSADEMAAESGRLTELLTQRCELEGLRRRVRAGHVVHEGIRDHLTHPAVPLPKPGRGQWFLSLWAALSIPMVLGAIAAVVLLDQVPIAFMMAVIGLVAPPTEQLVRGRLRMMFWALLVEATLVGFVLFAIEPLAKIAGVVVGATLVVFALGLLMVNMRELAPLRNR